MSMKSAFLRSCVFTLASLVAFAQAAVAADGVVLKPKADGPRDVYVEFDSTAVQTMDGPDGKPMEIKSRSVFGLIQRETQKDGSTIIDATIDRLLGDMSFSANMRSLYDTDEPDYEEASPMHRDTFGPLLNATLRVTLGADGLGKSVEGGQAVRDKLTAMGEQNYVASSLAQAEFTDAQIQSVIGETATILYPYKELKVGDTWKKMQKDVYPQVGKVNVTYECKLDGIEKARGGEFAVVSFKGVVAKDADEKPEKDKRLGKIDATFAGVAKFDIAQGRFVDITRDMKAKLEIPPWFTKEPTAPLMKIDGQFTMAYSVGSIADRLKQKGEISKRIAEKKAREEAEEAAAMAGPVDPVTPENAPVAWTQWGGPSRNFRSDATGLANRWPKEGPAKLWERELGDGYSAVLCEGDALYTMYSARDKEDPFKGDEVVVALDAKTGKTLWEHKYAAPWPKSFQMEFGSGPYSTPLIVGNRVFTVGCTAILNCLDKKTGKVEWSKDLHEEYKAELLGRGYGASPVAYKGNILLPVSKEKGKSVMAFAQSDGSVAWAGGEFEPGYATLVPIKFEGVEQIVAFSGKSLVGIDAVDHNQAWSVDHPTQWGPISRRRSGMSRTAHCLFRRPMAWVRAG
ncbi:MAG: PQQ-binding-like beta-propeller repeat protein [Planctomycetes bacterium]|nr:PQQ-binding-like beta-propeller repeat protein [Planctomycetota bacterium]